MGAITVPVNTDLYVAMPILAASNAPASGTATINAPVEQTGIFVVAQQTPQLNLRDRIHMGEQKNKPPGRRLVRFSDNSLTLSEFPEFLH